MMEILENPFTIIIFTIGTLTCLIKLKNVRFNVKITLNKTRGPMTLI